MPTALSIAMLALAFFALLFGLRLSYWSQQMSLVGDSSEATKMMRAAIVATFVCAASVAVAATLLWSVCDNGAGVMLVIFVIGSAIWGVRLLHEVRNISGLSKRDK